MGVMGGTGPAGDGGLPAIGGTGGLPSMNASKGLRGYSRSSKAS